jgi:hypothetical protein
MCLHKVENLVIPKPNMRKFTVFSSVADPHAVKVLAGKAA